MRMNQVIKEDQQLDELSLGGIGRGLEKAASGVAKGVGYAAGIPTGLGQAFQQGKARAVAGLSGALPDQPKQPKPVNKTFAKEYERLTGKPWGDVPPEEKTKIQTSVSDIDNRIRQIKTELDSLMTQRNSLLGASHPQATKAAPASGDSGRIEPEMGEVPPSGGLGQAFQQGKAQAVAGLSGDAAKAPQEPEPSRLASLAGVPATTEPSAGASVTPSDTASASGGTPAAGSPVAKPDDLRPGQFQEPEAVQTPPTASAPAAPEVPTSLPPKATKQTNTTPIPKEFQGGVPTVPKLQATTAQTGTTPNFSTDQQPSVMANKDTTGKDIPKQFQGGVPTVPSLPTAGKKPAAPTPPTATAAQTPPPPAAGALPGSKAGSFWANKLNEEDNEILEFLQRLNALKVKM